VDYALNRLNWFMYEGCETDEDFEEQLKRALISCQKRIDHEVSAIPQRRGMGSTLTLAYIVWPKMFLVHVGDTRCYLSRGGQLQQLTRDHTLAELSESPREGNPELEHVEHANADAEIRRPMSSVLWNVIGGDDAEPHPDACAIELAMGDTILLCSDGLTNCVTRKQLQETLSSDRNTAEMCQQLIDKANSAGGSDNITVVIGRFVEHSEVELKLEAVELPIDASQPDTVDFEDAVSVEPA
ncbi:MAG: serine/threonine-protein phosphatase, partial [Planctomycetales bacterium]|nr:serine/threonine-protein phosphatase [Planctomycetales bacterium]